jgi:hypothetical protein
VVRKRGGIKKVEEGSGSGKKKKVGWIEEERGQGNHIMERIS